MSRPRTAFLAALLTCGCHLTSGTARVNDPLAAAPCGETRRARVARLGDVLTRGVAGIESVTFDVADRKRLGAWAWPPRSVEVSRSLVDLLDDAELSAALAHELGHLLGGPDSGGALAGADADALEEAADHRGCALLAAQGIPGERMVAMLEKLALALHRPPALLRRIEAARQTCGARP